MFAEDESMFFDYCVYIYSEEWIITHLLNVVMLAQFFFLPVEKFFAGLGNIITKTTAIPEIVIKLGRGCLFQGLGIS